MEIGNFDNVCVKTIISMFKRKPDQTGYCGSKKPAKLKKNDSKNRSGITRVCGDFIKTLNDCLERDKIFVLPLRGKKLERLAVKSSRRASVEHIKNAKPAHYCDDTGSQMSRCL
ncbi:hypothetical protein M153_2470005156 [Pseudoloma neurophilia]|uniref:Uncharacterized protein n=1 Tax=Pseudoloma neurophilia TaxID=146866 RepID=A0A0R0M5X3_9MICR|nr:hypothetical protein M153_2470005156 [Pseudoloma neurophilia]